MNRQGFSENFPCFFCALVLEKMIIFVCKRTKEEMTACIFVMMFGGSNRSFFVFPN